MRVKSDLADVDFHLGAIRRGGNGLVIVSSEGSSLPTVVEVGREDVLAGMAALLRSPSALWYVLTVPFRRASVNAASSAASTAVDLINKPW
jgi:hypothetical protein